MTNEILEQLNNCTSFLRTLGYSSLDVNDIALGEFHDILQSYCEYHDDDRDNKWVKFCRICGEEIKSGLYNDGKHDYHWECLHDM